MMETVVGVSKQQPYSPHLKKVLKTYQLSAVKSLQGPSTLLGTAAVHGMDKGVAVTAVGTSAMTTTVTVVPKKEPAPPSASDCGDVFMTPPPFPIQQLPILTTPDQSHSELSETVLEGETISCFEVGGEKRLCLPQVFNSVLREFSLFQIRQVCEEFRIFFSECNKEQLIVLKMTGILPKTAHSCGLITKTDAERLSIAMLHRSAVNKATVCHEGALSVKVYHECFGKCKGICTPELYTDSNAQCIECVECHGMFSPQKFVCHAHHFREKRTCHWGFDPSNWRSYLLIAEDQEEHEHLAKVLEKFKEQHDNTVNTLQHNKRKQVHQLESDYKELPDLQALKKPKLDPSLDPYSAYLYPVADPSTHFLWYDSWARMSAFRPWPALLAKEGKGQPPPQPFMRDSLPSSVPTYLSHSPPVLLHPERVVPMSESERFERSFQPNVALAPIPQQHRTRIEPTKWEVKAEERETYKKSVCSKKSSTSPVSLNSAVPLLDAHNITATVPPSSTATFAAPPATGGPASYNPEIELSTDTEDSSSDVAGETALIGTESKSVVEQLVAVLDTLCDAKEAARAQVLDLVERLAMRLEQQEVQCQQLREENKELQRLHHQQEQRLGQQEERIAELQRRLRQDTPVKQDPDALQDKMVAMEKELRTLRSEVANLPGGCLGRRAREPSRSCSGGSPVSVITSPSPVIPLVIKSEPVSSE